MDVLQRRLVPGAGNSERAELFVSGLLEEAPGGYRFVRGAAELLQEGATTFERWDTFNAVSEHLRAQTGLGGDLLAMVRDPAGRGRLDGHDQPFAALAGRLADQLRIPREDRPADLPDLPPAGPPAGPPAAREPMTVDALAPADHGVLASPVRRIFAGAIAVLNGAPLNIVDVGLDGIATFDVRRDQAGTPHSRARPPTAWGELGEADLSQGLVVLAARLQSGVPDVLVCSAPEDPLAERAMGWLRAVRPDAPAVAEQDAQVGALIEEAIAEDPLKQPYELVVLERRPDTGRLTLSARTLFPAGARRGATARLPVRCEPGDERGTVFAVVARRPTGRPWLVSVRSAKVPSGRHELTAVLERPGQVGFGAPADLAGRLTPDDRSWQELIALVPRRFRPAPDPAHLICAVEVSGRADRVAERLSRVRQAVTMLAQELPDSRLQVSLVSYGSHSFGRRPSEPDPVPVPIWAAPASAALDELTEMERQGALDTGYPLAAMIEDMLVEVYGRLGPPGRGRTALLTIGSRRPHPPRVHPSEILPCPHRYDWEATLSRLRAYPGMRLGAICDRPLEHADRTWLRLGGRALAHLDAVDIPQLIDALGLLPPADSRLPFPLIELG